MKCRQPGQRVRRAPCIIRGRRCWHQAALVASR
jgi:hypothetical protein